MKNITGALSGGIYVLDKGFELDNREYIRKGWKMVKTNVDRVNRLALELLDFSRDPSPAYEHCDPNRPFREIQELMVSRMEAYRIRLVMELDENLPHVWMDPEGIHRALLNLVNNAVYACLDIRCTHREKTITLRTRYARHWAVEYQVEDTGCGMEDEAREKLFKTFFSTKGYDGTGLGLMMSKRIVDAHEGVMEILSERDRGTVCHVYLPRRGVVG